MDGEQGGFVSAVVRVEELNPASALNEALALMGKITEGQRLLYVAFYRLGVADGAFAQNIRAAEMVREAADQ